VTNANPNPDKNWLRSLSVLPAVGSALLPALACPACWPAYAGLLSALGLGFVDYTPFLLPITTVFLAIAVLSLAHRAKTRHGYTPFFVGLGAAILLVASKFFLLSEIGTYMGIVILVGASIWNVWPARKGVGESCPVC
jgi:mercuric ion transport protein